MQIGTDRGHGFLKLVQGSTTVRVVWEVTLNARNPPEDFAALESISWTGGTGSVTSFDDVLDILRFVLDTGVGPSIGDVIAGTTAVGTVASFGFGSPPDLVNQLPAGVFPKIFHRNGNTPIYHLGGVILAGEVTLTGPYLETSEEEAEFIIHQDYEPNFGAPIPNPGDSEVLILVNEAINILGANLASVTTPVITWTAIPLINGSNPVAGFQAPEYYRAPNGIVYLRGALWQATVQPIAQLPIGVGVRPPTTLRFGTGRGAVASTTSTELEINTDGEFTTAHAAGNGVILGGLWFDSTGGS